MSVKDIRIADFLGQIVRRTLTWLLFWTAGASGFMALAMLALLPVHAAQDRAQYAALKRIAEYKASTGHLPARFIQNGPGGSPHSPWIWASTPAGCDPHFAAPSSDRFALGFWRGDWWECYGYPSGATTMPMSVLNYLGSETGVEILIYGLVSATAAMAAIFIRPRRKDRRARKPVLAIISWGFSLSLVTLLANAFFVLIDPDDDQFVENPAAIRHYADVMYHTIYRVESSLLGVDRPDGIVHVFGPSLLAIAIGIWLLWFLVGAAGAGLFEAAKGSIARHR